MYLLPQFEPEKVGADYRPLIELGRVGMGSSAGTPPPFEFDDTHELNFGNYGNQFCKQVLFKLLF